MARHNSTRKKSKDSDRWLVANAPKPAPSKPEYACPRCGDDIGSPSQQAEHSGAVHLGGGR